MNEQSKASVSIEAARQSGRPCSTCVYGEKGAHARVQGSGRSDDWPHGATVKLRFVDHAGVRGEIGWAKRDTNGNLVSVYSALPLDPDLWEVLKERNPPEQEADALLDPKYRAQIQGLLDVTVALNGTTPRAVVFSTDVVERPTERSMLEQTRPDIALQACRTLIEAYRAAEDSSASVSWEDIDTAYALALEAFPQGI